MSNGVRLLCCALTVCCSVLAQSASSFASDVREVHKRAFEKPEDREAFRRYLATLPKVRTPEGRTFHVVEGDLLLTEDEVRVHVAAKSARMQAAEFRPELIVNLVDSRPDYWPLAQLPLTYAVDRKSFTSQAHYDRVVANMAKAAGAWENACGDCGMLFRHAYQHDGAPNHENVKFIVRQLDVFGEYIAAAFFPSWPASRRYINIDPSYFAISGYDPVGVLRHELGHVLGYQHEHNRDVAGCAKDGTNWAPLTPYDPHSVMHYFCAGAGTLALELTDVDRKGHQGLYGRVSGRPAGAVAEGEHLVTADLQGGEVAENIVRMAIALARADGLVTRDYEVLRGDNICLVYMRAMSFPPKVRCPEPAMLELHGLLNGGARRSVQDVLSVGKTIRLPQNVSLTQRSFTDVYDLAMKEQNLRFATDRTRWNARQVTTGPDGKARVTFDRYKMLLAVPDRSSALRAEQALRPFESPNVFVSTTARSFKDAPSNSMEPLEYLKKCQASTSPGEAAYATLLGIPEMPACAAQCTEPRCSRILLIDKPVAANWDLQHAVRAGVTFGPGKPVKLSETPCVQVDFKEAHHGTHLAGIMVSERNGYGFVGLSTAARLSAFDRDRLNASALGDLIDLEMEDAAASPARKLFVFAGRFPEYPDEALNVNDRSRLERESQRFVRNLAAHRIRGTQALWITAAGQVARNTTPVELEPVSVMAPMNMGDLNNVVVVTACDDCSDKHASLLPEANYSQRLVALAAPGRHIVGHADSASIAVADGTSQATAFVAGVASALYNCYPDWYQTDRVRKRLVLTSRPAFAEQDYGKLQGGIVSPALALRDPTKNWVRLEGEEMKEVEVEGWCRPSLTLGKFFGYEASEEETYRTKHIRRITRYPRSSDARPQWVVFHRVPTADAPYDLRRSKPGVTEDAKLLKLADSSVITVGQVEELLLARPVEPTPEGCK